MEHRVNKQSERTRRWITQALLKLLRTVPYASISVSDLTREADVSRQSFYRNFESKDAVVSRYLSMIFADYRAAFVREREGLGRRRAVELVFETLYAHKDDVIALVASVPRGTMMLALQDALLDAVAGMESFPKDLSKASDSFGSDMLMYQLGGVSAVVFKWVSNEMPSSPRDMTERLLSVMESVGDGDMVFGRLVEAMGGSAGMATPAA
ncbi:TetR/AcrR family transcriptional regulator [Bifidobacterium eulemuris]|uniref:Transcriptional regulator n=1 Tax=Bifidobacterium eulemuris TaxID=1765219 RepID=A0A261GBZ9_9BIFI|nr:TetR/AcrR family transcriptional regulator [Bifidobacterium eulemuris]OZG68957.1 transcriptional regulator [Bifidobacterium eulemuris]QOL31508.1 TetR/AcrR family transcriptional regulator [Bifidobacterium eulemuris]